jgi:histidinol dehydrogenase
MDTGKLITAILVLAERANEAEFCCVEWLRTFEEGENPSSELIEKTEKYASKINLTIESMQERANKLSRANKL